MNTTELKKLAEAANLTIYQRARMTSDEFLEAEQLRSRYRKESPAAILKLLQINAELVEALKAMEEIGALAEGELGYHGGIPEAQAKARAALAKAEGGEL